MSDLHTHNSEIVIPSSQSFLVGEPAYVCSSSMHRQTMTAPLRLFRYRVLKRALDIFLILLVSPVLLLVTAVVAAAVRMSSPGPIFFSHRRIRRHGAFFTMWKFRTMCVNSNEVLDTHLKVDPAAQAEWRRTHKLKYDPRVTRVGQFLRKTSLDELPQLWNVLTGSMSLVGPRPIVAAEVEKYGEFFTDYCLVKPGITGLWQVSGRSACTYEERVQLDRKYAHTWSLSGDFSILARTLTAVVNQDGAY
jgi:Undecaprenyl-phosphate galactose phosphotransferase WbaP